MEDNANPTYFQFDSPKEQSSIIKVIGVGGGGGNAVSHMFRQGIKGVDFVVCNTDAKALNSSPVHNKISIGELGAGNDPEVARQAALDHADIIREALSHNTKMLFITAGMGGGTGTGASPVVAEIAKSIDTNDKNIKQILTVAIVTLPFSFEGPQRLTQAKQGIQELSKHVDSIIVINNDKLRAFGNLGLSKAFTMADDVLLTAAKGIAEIITHNAYINIDLKDVNTVMQHSGTALMGTGCGTGENRAKDAVVEATTSVLLDDNDISGAKNVLLYFAYSSEHELTMDEHSEITDYIQQKTNGSANFIWGAGADDSLGETLKVILIATGFDKATEDTTETLFKLEPEDETKSEPIKQQPDDEGFVFKQADTPVADKEEAPVISSLAEVPTLSTPTATSNQEEPSADYQPVETLEPDSNTEVIYRDDKRIFVFNDESEDAEPKPVRSIRAGNGEFRTEISATVGEEIVLVRHSEPATDAESPKTSVDVAPPYREPEVATAPLFTDHSAPVLDEKPQANIPAASPKTVGFSDQMAHDRAARIKYINNLLRNNPDGAEFVQKLNATALEGSELYEGAHSSEREASSSIVSPDGTLERNPYLWGNRAD